jgi:hypothetical protein
MTCWRAGTTRILHITLESGLTDRALQLRYFQNLLALPKYEFDLTTTRSNLVLNSDNRLIGVNQRTDHCAAVVAKRAARGQAILVVRASRSHGAVLSAQESPSCDM